LSIPKNPAYQLELSADFHVQHDRSVRAAFDRRAIGPLALDDIGRLPGVEQNARDKRLAFENDTERIGKDLLGVEALGRLERILRQLERTDSLEREDDDVPVIRWNTYA
jgi:hypothetical protein